MIPFTKQRLKVVGVSKKHACRVETPIKLQQITFTYTLLHKQQYKGQTWMKHGQTQTGQHTGQRTGFKYKVMRDS